MFIFLVSNITTEEKLITPLSLSPHILTLLLTSQGLRIARYVVLVSFWWTSYKNCFNSMVSVAESGFSGLIDDRNFTVFHCFPNPQECQDFLSHLCQLLQILKDKISAYLSDLWPISKACGVIHMIKLQAHISKVNGASL